MKITAFFIVDKVLSKFIITQEVNNMKTMADGKQITTRIYYYLLDWNDFDSWRFMAKTFNKTKLHELTYNEAMELFKHATQEDLKVG